MIQIYSLASSSFLSTEIALPISSGDALYDYTASWSWNNDNEISASVSNHVTGDIGGTSSSSWHCEYGYSYGCGCGCTYSCGGCSHYDQPEGDYDETVSHTGWKNGQYGPLFTTRWSPFSGSVSEYSYCCTYSYGCGCSYDYSYSCFYGSFSAPNFSSYVSDSTYSGCQYISGSTSHAGNYWWSDSHGSMPASQIPTEGGRYHSGSYDYYGYVYVGSNVNSPVGDSGTTMGTPTPIEGGSDLDSDNYTLVNVETYLPPLPVVATPEPAIAGNVPGISPMPDGSSWGAGWSAFWYSIGTSGYDFGNHLSFGSLDEERYNAQVTAAGEELYNTAINLGASNDSIMNGVGWGQALAGEVFGTNSISDAITGYDLGTNQSLSGMERLQEAAQGVSQVASTLAGGLKIGQGIVPKPSTASKIQTLGNQVKTWLGDGSRMIINDSGDRIFQSANGLREIRFDFNNFHPHEKPHIHICLRVQVGSVHIP